MKRLIICLILLFATEAMAFDIGLRIQPDPFPNTAIPWDASYINGMIGFSIYPPGYDGGMVSTIQPVPPIGIIDSIGACFVGYPPERTDPMNDWIFQPGAIGTIPEITPIVIDSNTRVWRDSISVGPGEYSVSFGGAITFNP